MTLSELKKHFREELSGLYSESESVFLCSVFVQETMGFEPYDQRKFADQRLSESEESQFSEIISALRTGKPSQQILGKTEFSGLQFFVNEQVLIPRPETEELLEFAIQEIKKSNLKNQNVRILDIGTGSGIIPIVLKKHFPEAEISAIDYSEKALEVARRNAVIHQTDIHFFYQNYLEENLNQQYDIIISNPPYIGIDEQDQIEISVKDFEPKLALFSPTSDALIFYRKIAEDAQHHLSENGMIFLEINQKLGQETLDLFKKFPDRRLIKDLSGNDRFVYVAK